ncbi:MAG: holdfast anchoring protein HfaA [Micropepsaceae bacterium]
MQYRSATTALVAATAVALTLISSASAQTVRRSSGDGADVMARAYGTSPGQENAPMNGSTRDANGNRVIVNGVYAGSAYTSQDGLTYGVGRNSAGAGTVSGTAIGNNLNVVVSGSYNTVIVTADQNNSGDQTVVLNGGLKF